MKRTVTIVVGLALLGAAFFGGYAVRTARTATASATGRPILYCVDPMHPAYKSDSLASRPTVEWIWSRFTGIPAVRRVHKIVKVPDWPRRGCRPVLSESRPNGSS